MSTRLPPTPSGLPVLGQTLDFARDQLGFQDGVVEECGDVVRVRVLGAGEYVILAHPDHFERALVDERETFAKTEDFYIAFGEGLLSTEGEQWRRQRDALEEFFYPAKIRSYAEEIVEMTERRIDRWDDSDVISLAREMRDLSLDVLFATLFDRRLDVDGDQELRRAANDLNLWFKSTSWALPRWIPTPARRRFHEAVDVLEAEAEAMLAESKRDDSPEDLLSTIVASRREGEIEISDEELIDQVVTLIFAGHDTTLPLLTFSLDHVARHDEVRERFHDELDDVLGGDRPGMSDLMNLAVTENIVLETLRRYPSVHTIPRKTTRDVDIDGHHVPADTRIHLSVWHVQRDDRFWDAPDEWRPGRWEDTSQQEQGYAFVPFGAGPRTCLGRRFALLESRLVLSTISQEFRLYPKRDLELDPEMTTQPAHDVPVQVHRR